MQDIRLISELKNWNKNPRAVKKEDFDRLKKQITELGQYKPLLITSDGTVLGGNMRLRAYHDLGITDVWVSVVEPKTEAEMVKYALSDNDRAGYYVDQELAELIQEYGAEINLENYKVDLGQAISLAEVLNQFAPDVEEDEAPEVAEGEPDSKLGEVYQLGRHRLMCGDSTKIEDVEKLIDGQKADMVFTDPPYGMDFQSNMRTESEQFDKLKNDDVVLTDWIIPTAQSSKGWFIISTTWKVLKTWLNIPELSTLGDLTNMIIWDKGGGGIGDLNNTLATDYEILLAFGRGNKIYGKRLGSVWQFNKDNPNTYKHPTQKPVALPAQAIKTLSSTGIILDVFGGSGSTLIACEQLERTCYMMELDPKYCDVIRKRYDNYINNRKETANG